MMGHYHNSEWRVVAPADACRGFIICRTIFKSHAHGNSPGPPVHLQLVVPGFEHMLHHIQL
jgi:hypothetical protein